MAQRRKKTLVETDLSPLPVMVVCGQERALVDAAVSHIRSSTLQGAMVDLNHDRLQGRQVSAEQVIGCAKTLPVMAPRRLVEVADAEALGADAMLKIADYAKEPAQEAVLLLIARDIDKRTKAAKALDKLGCLFRYEHLTENGMIRYATKRARSMGMQLGEESASVLVASVGNELQLVERALEKLMLVVTDGQVDIEHIEKHIAQTRVESIFKLTEAIAQGDRGGALSVLGQMLDAREAPLRILATLAWQQRQLIRARSMLSRGASSSDILRAVKVFRFRDEFMRQVRSMSDRKITAGLQLIYKADRLLKSSRTRPRAVMERTVMDLTQA